MCKYKQIFRMSALGLIITVVLFACGSKNMSRTYGWTSLGEEINSITLALENMFDEGMPCDSIALTLDSLRFFIEREKSPIGEARLLFWKSRLYNRLESQDSALSFARDALLRIDSANNTYDYLRTLNLIDILDDKTEGSLRYRHLLECLSYAQTVSDKMFEGYASVNMANMLCDVGEYGRSIDYINRSDSLFAIMGKNKLIVKNQINRAIVFAAMGDVRTHDSIMKTIMNHPLMKDDAFVCNVLPVNLYISTHEPDYLYKGYDNIKNKEEQRSLRGLYRGLLADLNYNRGCYDSVVYYADGAMDDLPYVADYGHRSVIWFNNGLSMLIKGCPDSALICRVEYEACIDSMQSFRDSESVLRLSALKEIERREAIYADSLSRRNMTAAIIVVVVLVVGMSGVLSFKRRCCRQRMRNEMELEKTKNKMVATALSVEEKDRVIGSLKANLSELREEGEVKEEDLRRMELTINSHIQEYDTDEAFQQIFDVVNPGFKKRLRERCPNLADSSMKLACYILMELDNKKIARLMMIKPESVHQARWRLRQRLGLKEGETLESALNALNEKR